MSADANVRVAWLMPGRGFSRLGGPRYTLPLVEEFQRAYPSVVFITTGAIHPYYQQVLNIRSRGAFRPKELYAYPSAMHYGRSVNILSPAIALDLLRLKPQIVISTELNLWTIVAALLKPIGHWKLIVLWTGSSPGVDLVDDPIRLSVRRRVAKHVDAFITNSMRGRGYLRDYLRVPDGRAFRIVYKPGDVKTLTKVSSSHPLMEEARRPRFLYVGQLVRRKGINYLLDAWARLRDLTSNHGSLLLIGDGPERNEFVERAEALALNDVHFIGQVEYTSLGSWYQACEVFVFPTLEDNWGNVITEAITFGKAVLCSKYAGTHELVHHGENGFIFEPRDIEELAQLMLTLIESPELVEKFGRKSLEIKKPYSISSAVAGFGEIIELVLKDETN